ncbi:hypothetical protein [Streptomyces sp. CB03911]|uniref:hypothetical protein n=1 Tax=Streptomyces sp. CB03911 TaxID=1804758 RepID=UPI00093CE7FB|nr:hypothetical protein [Streptomyces sp. CB03911]OKI24405.1 hypothetical protein A6A07_05965 [Streptomyces sp. CB03911]
MAPDMATVRTAKNAGYQVGTVGTGKTPHAIYFENERQEIETLCTGKGAAPLRKAKLADALCRACGRKLAALAEATPAEDAKAEQPTEAKPKRRRAAKKAEDAPVVTEQAPAEPEGLFPAEDAAVAEQPAEDAPAERITPNALRNAWYGYENPGVAITRADITEMLADVMDLEYDADGDPAEHVWDQLAELVNTAGEAGADKSGQPMDADNLPAAYDPESLPTVVLTSVTDPDPESTETPLEGKVTSHVESYRSIKAVVDLVTEGASLAKRVVSASKKAEAGPKQLAIMQHKIKLEIPRDADGWPDLMVQQQRTRDALADMWTEAGLKVVKPAAGEEMDPASKAAHKVRGATRAHGNDVRVLYLRGVMDDEEQRAKFPGAETTEDLFKGYGIPNETTAEKRERQAAEKAGRAAAPAESDGDDTEGAEDGGEQPTPAEKPQDGAAMLASIRAALASVDLTTATEGTDPLVELWAIRDRVAELIGQVVPAESDAE